MKIFAGMVTEGTSFKSNMILDIGASQKEGSCKVYYSSTPTDETFFKERTTLNDLGKARFEDQNEFIGLVVKKIAETQKGQRDTVKSHGYPESENILKNVAVFVPSHTLANMALYLPNLKDGKNNPLSDINFGDFKNALRTNGVQISEDMNFKILHDVLGTGLAMSKKLYDSGMLQEGSLYTACITGGGCGIANIEMPDEANVIIKSSGSSYLTEGFNIQKISKAGASAPALIENFCKAMGFEPEIIDEIKSCHKSEFALEPTVTYAKDVNSQKLKKLLVDSNLFEIVDESDNMFTISVRSEYIHQYNNARRNAIDKYCLAFARLAVIKKTEGANGMIVTGTLAHAVDRSARFAYGTPVADWITQHLIQSFSSRELDKMDAAYGFKVLCENKFFIDNNADCGGLVHLAKFVGSHRNNWLKINIKDLSRSSVKKVLCK